MKETGGSLPSRQSVSNVGLRRAFAMKSRMGPGMLPPKTLPFVICESGDSTAADKGSLHRFADQIGMTTAGLAEMGWAVAVDELASRRAESTDEAPAEPKRQSSRDRFKTVGG